MSWYVSHQKHYEVLVEELRRELEETLKPLGYEVVEALYGLGST